MSQPETFEQFYARAYGFRKGELRRLTDPVERAALKKWQAEDKKKVRAAWDEMQRPNKFALSQETLEKIRADHQRSERQVSRDNRTYRVINGRAS